MSKPLSGHLPLHQVAGKVCVNIASPAYGGTFAAPYLHFFFATLTQGSRHRTTFTFSTVDVADIVLARNYLVSKFYFHQPQCSHILFVDDDMGVDGDLLYEMLALEQDVVGTLAPRRKLDLRQLHASTETDFDKAYAQACSFIGKPIGPGPAPGFQEVKQCGTGFLLISRHAIQRMVERCPEVLDGQRYRNTPLGKEFDEFLTPFNPITLPDRQLSEDLSFCHRWTELCGGRIYASTGSRITHVGKMNVTSCYDDLG
jgi:hypothetical protein